MAEAGAGLAVKYNPSDGPTHDMDAWNIVITGATDGIGKVAAKELAYWGALLITYPGDTTVAALGQVCDLTEWGSARVQR